MKSQACRTVHVRIKPGPLAKAFLAMGLAAKNLRNTGVFLIKNVLSSFGPDGKLLDLAGLHADANGALNILRKAMPAFHAHAALSPRFGLWWLWPRGLRPFATKDARARA